MLRGAARLIRLPAIPAAGSGFVVADPVTSFRNILYPVFFEHGIMLKKRYEVSR